MFLFVFPDCCKTLSINPKPCTPNLNCSPLARQIADTPFFLCCTILLDVSVLVLLRLLVLLLLLLLVSCYCWPFCFCCCCRQFAALQACTEGESGCYWEGPFAANGYSDFMLLQIKDKNSKRQTMIDTLPQPQVHTSTHPCTANCCCSCYCCCCLCF